MKCCAKCGEFKQTSDFYKRAKAKDGLQSNCKDCQREQRKRNFQAEMAKPEGRAKWRAWAKAYDEKLKQKDPAEWRARHDRTQVRERQRQELASAYLRALIASSVGCSRSAVPNDLIAAKKAHLAAHRLIKERSK